MMKRNMTKVVIAVALTLAVMLSAGVVGEELGVQVVSTAQACGNSGGGGGC